MLSSLEQSCDYPYTQITVEKRKNIDTTPADGRPGENHDGRPEISESAVQRAQKRRPRRPTRNPKDHIMRTAERLFAQRGIDAVGLREIAREAGYKNVNSINYYCGSKENLVNEVLLEGSRTAENWRRFRLQLLQESGRAISLRDIVKVMLAPTIERKVSPYFTRLVAQVLTTAAAEFYALIGDELMWSLNECRKYIRKLVPLDQEDLVGERILLFNLYFSNFLSTRDIRIASGENDQRWYSHHIIEHFIDTTETLLKADISPETRRAYQEYRRRKRSDDLPSDPSNVKYSPF